jgi:hypothetical protein
MAGEKSGLGEHEIWMVALEQKFDDLLTFIHLMVKRDAENENRKKDNNKDTNDEIPEGHPHTSAGSPPRPLTPPKPEGKDSQLDSKIDGLEEKI